MVYERTHTRDLEELSGMHLSRMIPFAAVTFTIASMASMGLPGFSGFVAEFQVLLGTWQSAPTLTVIAGLGILIGVAYTLRALQKAFFNDDLPASSDDASVLSMAVMSTITIPERVGAALLIASTLVVGLFPGPLLDLIVTSFGSPLFDWLRTVPGP
jgi:NADH-quinone oxidoreductase subunit M